MDFQKIKEWLRDNIVTVLAYLAGIVAVVFVAQAAFGQTSDDETREYRYFETAIHKEDLACYPGEDYAFNLRAFGSEFDMQLVESGGPFDWHDGRNFITHHEFHDGASIFETDRIFVVGVDVETSELCIMMTGVRNSF